MNILQILDSVSKKVVDDTAAGGHIGKDLQDLAVDAVTKGFNSVAWKEYMSLFADNKKQLERLTVAKFDDLAYFREGRAYIAANGTCGPDTNGLTGKGVKAEIDQGLDPTPDGKIVDPGQDPGLDGFVRPMPTPRI